MAKKCMKCGGAMKMAKGGTVSKPFAAGIPYGTGAGATDGKNGMMKKGGAVKKMAKGGSSFGMLSVKAGVDKNPKPTAADRIVGAKKKAKFGASVPVQHSPAAGRVRSASGIGTVPVGARKKMGGSVKKK